MLSCHRDGEIAILTLDNPPVNALSAAVRQALWQMADDLDADDSVRAVVLRGSGRGFIAGADLREFDQPAVGPHLPDLVDRIESAAKPWIAAIQGPALGGGLEIALGCRFRIASADARLGLPEVNLGLIPGASGTVRTPRLVGVPDAVDLASSGHPWTADRALAARLVDRVATGDLTAKAIAFAREVVGGPLPPPVSARDLQRMPEDFWQSARKKAQRAGYEAPLAIIDCIRRATEASFADALRHERETFLRLKESEEAKALRHVFLAERSASRPAALSGVEPPPIRRIGIVGGGTMGAGIASACLISGWPVVMIERDSAAVARGVANVEKTLAASVKRGKISGEQRAAMLAGLGASNDYEALAGCDLVIEAVFEEIGVKRQVFAELDRVCRPDAILATNTSYLDPRLIAEGLSNPERFIGLHFFSPANVMRLLEIVPIPDTSPEVLSAAFALAARLGKVPVRAGICEGFIGNRIFRRYRAEAEELVRQGVPHGNIDAAMRQFGYRMGPFEAQDLSGLDISFLQREGLRAAGQIVPDALSDVLVRAGRKGRKTGGGWYDYPTDGGGPQPSAKAGELLAPLTLGDRRMTATDIARHLVDAMSLEGRAILDEGIAATAEEIDLVQIHGYGFPRWKGGPMWAARSRV